MSSKACRGAKSDVYWALLSLLVLALISLVALYINAIKFQKEQPQQTVNVQETQALSKNVMEPPSDSSLAHYPLPNSNILPMQVRDIKLPDVPANSQVSSQSAMLEAPPKPLAPSYLKNSKNTAQSGLSNGEEKSELSALTNSLANPVEPPKNISDDQIHNVLEALSGISLQIVMPSSDRLREQTVTYLHTCVGVGLAAIITDKQSPALMPLAPLPAPASKILRQISGKLNKYEHALSAAYAPNLHVVRVYPASFDTTLSQHIAQHLHGNALEQFYAEYELSQNRLSLRNIIVNQQKIAQTWLLFDGYEHKCRL